jgi:hypothetical protein
MERNGKLTGAVATFRRLGHWAAGTRAIGAHLAGAARLRIVAPRAPAGDQPAATARAATSSAKSARERSSIDRLAAGICSAIIARLPGSVRSDRSALSSFNGHTSGPAANDRERAAKRSDPRPASEPSIRDRVRARLPQMLGTLPTHRVGIAAIAGLPRRAEAVASPPPGKVTASAFARNAGVRVDRERFHNAIARFATPPKQGTLEGAGTRRKTIEVANQLFGAADGSAASPGVVGTTAPNREYRAQAPDQRDYRSRSSAGRARLATPLADGSRSIGARPWFNFPGAIASRYGVGARLAGPERIAAAPSFGLPTALDGGGALTSAGAVGGSARDGVVINSSPTIVINEAHGADFEGRVLATLRQHGGELYAQWRREVGRRRRTEF